jgi:LmbE family N-acetylglucosaminyl deacetylase
MSDDSAISRVLAIMAHPDDVDFGSAGTIATWTDAGLEVSYCIVTDGDAGGSDPSVSRPDMARLRQAEQTAAAKQVGVSDVRFLGYPDGRVEATLGLRKDLARVIRTVRPDRVLCPSPDRFYARIGASHPDHRAADTVVDITATFGRKVAALRAHASQISDPAELEDRLRTWTSSTAATAGLPDGHLAEGFQVLQTG